MASSEEDYHELLNVEQYVDVDKLRELAQYGVPSSVRGQVWKYLLGVAGPDKSSELTDVMNQSRDYLDMQGSNSDVVKKIQGEVKRYVNLRKRGDMAEKFKNILLAYVNSNHCEYVPGMVHMLGPFVACLTEESDMYHCFAAFMHKIDWRNRHTHVEHQVSSFIMLFQSLLPDLSHFFEDEEVEPSEWVVSWLQSYLARELPLESVMRLWDTYFALESFDLHMYVALAILMRCSDELFEIGDEAAEIKGFLQHLPPMDIDKILTEANNLRQEVRLSGRLS